MANLATLAMEISDALSKGKQGCPLCSLWSRQEASIVGRLRADAKSDKALTDSLPASSGFCNRHTHALHNEPSSEGSSGCSECARVVLMKFQKDLGPLLAGLKERHERKAKGEELLTETILQLEKSISGGAMCPVCSQLLESDKDRVSSLLQILESKDAAGLYSKSDAICMPHFATAMQLLPRSAPKDIEGVWSLLVRTQLSALESIDHILNERMKKYSWDYRNEAITPEEANAQKTAMLSIAGVDGLYCRPRKTSLRPARLWA